MSPWVSDLNGLSENWLDAIWQASWKGSAAILLVAVICRMFPRVPAAAKCWLWRLVFLQMLAAFFWTTPIRLAWLPAANSEHKSNPAVLNHGSSPLEIELSDLPSRVENSGAETARFSLLKSAPIQDPSLTHDWRFRFSAILLFLWSVGLLVFALRLIAEWRTARRLAADTESLGDDSLLVSCHRLCERLRIAPVPKLLSSDQIKSPLLVGARKPKILFPRTDMCKCSQEALDLMLAHELAHVRRNDLWWCWLPVVSRLLFFFNPLIWRAHREYGLSQEIDCDELAMSAAGSSPANYGKMLLKFATQPGRVSPVGLISAGIFESKRNLERRLIAMKTTGRFSQKGLILISIAAIGIAGAGIVPWKLVAQQRATEQDDAPDPALNPKNYESSRAFPGSPKTVVPSTAYADDAAVSVTDETAPAATPAGSHVKYFSNYKELPSTSDTPDRIAAENRQKQKELYQEEIRMVEVLLKEAKKRFEIGAAPLDAVLELQKEVSSLNREVARLDSNVRRWKELALEEIALVERQTAARQKAFENGKATTADMIQLRRESLDLRRQLAAVESTASESEAATNLTREDHSPVEPAQVVRLSAPASGTIAQLFVKVGDPVKKGAKLAQLDNRRARSNLEATYAKMEMAHVDLRLARIDGERAELMFERKAQLAKNSLVSEDEITLARHEKEITFTRLEKIQAEIRLAEIQVNQAKLALDELTLRSPIDGTVVAIFAAAGERVSDLSVEPILILGSEVAAAPKPQGF